MSDSSVQTRTSQATTKRINGMVMSYASSNLLGDPWPYVRGRRFVTCSAMSSPSSIYSKSSDSGK